ncbi:hypothetical protein BCEN4_1280006 [Burkholderia cenocepacia]|nr:hypothetical protein BCEN4_1280006 [Burkholderia cenocepacia]
MISDFMMRYLQDCFVRRFGLEVVAHEWKSRSRRYQGKYLNRKFTVDRNRTIARE